MGAALITDVGYATNPSSTLTACTFTSPNSNTVRNTLFQNPISLLGMWRNGATKGRATITSPKLVPVTNGIDYAAPAGCTGQILDGPPYQVLTPQDVLTASVTGGGSESDELAIQSYYQNLPGVEMTLKHPGDIIGSAQFVFAWRCSITCSGTIGTQSNTVITTSEDSSTANVWYGVLGYTTDALLTAVGISGVDTSQSFIGGPGLLDVYKTRHYFVDLSNRSGMPCIPMWNSANKANTNITAVDVAASTTAIITLVLAQMPPNWQP